MGTGKEIYILLRLAIWSLTLNVQPHDMCCHDMA